MIDCTKNMTVACIAIQLNPKAYASYDDQNGACFKFFPETETKSVASKEGQKQIVDKYWKSKQWSEEVELILTRPHILSDSGKVLYSLMLGEEVKKRYAYKRELRRINELLGIKEPIRPNQIDVAAVKDTADIVAVAQRYTELHQRGRSWWGKCPLHAGGKERTPSFCITPDKERWHCFGACSKGGDVISLIQEVEGIGFREAVQKVGAV